jgi:hypothetical protein
MVRAAILPLLAALWTSGPALARETFDIVALERSWPSHFVLTGTKTEPTYVEHIRLARDGGKFVLTGGAPAGMAASTERIAVAPRGLLIALSCPASMDCAGPPTPSGFLASAAIVAAIDRGVLSGHFPALRFGAYRVICVPAEKLGITAPILDPCVEVRFGAVIAQRHRLSHRFDGPSLDPWSIELSVPSQFVVVKTQ